VGVFAQCPDRKIWVRCPEQKHPWVGGTAAGSEPGQRRRELRPTQGGRNALFREIAGLGQSITGFIYGLRWKKLFHQPRHASIQNSVCNITKTRYKAEKKIHMRRKYFQK
jgi:hypothetical protein